MGCFYSRGPAFLTIRFGALVGLRWGSNRVAKISLQGQPFSEGETGFVMGIDLDVPLKNQKTIKGG